jgi:Cys-tRNA(Pro)/Cys-tRNA(Cys) deacylase
MLDARGVAYEAFELPPGEKRSAEEAAALMGVPPELVYKTIVIVRERQGKPILCLTPGPSEVNLKKLAAALGEKKLRLPSQREAEQLTGLQAGGISPLALLHKGFQVCIDRAAERRTHIHVSGGQRGLNLRLAVADLLALTGARWVEAVDG